MSPDLAARFPLPPGAVIGILGGGQLGRMLAMAAARLGFDTAVLDPEPDAPAARLATHRPQFQHPVRLRNNIQVMLYHHHRVPLVHQPVQQINQPRHIVLVQPYRRLLQNVQMPVPRPSKSRIRQPPRQFTHQL